MNSNCLEDLQCPACAQLGPFEISVKVFAVMHDDGIDEYVGNSEWNEESVMSCKHCDHEGVVKDFRVSGWEVTPENPLMEGERVFYSPLMHDAPESDQGWYTLSVVASREIEDEGDQAPTRVILKRADGTGFYAPVEKVTRYNPHEVDIDVSIGKRDVA